MSTLLHMHIITCSSVPNLICENLQGRKKKKEDNSKIHMGIKWFPTIRESCSKMDKIYLKMSQAEGEPKNISLLREY